MKGKIYPSYVRNNATGKDTLVYGAFKKDKSGKTLMKNFYSKAEAEKWLKMKL